MIDWLKLTIPYAFGLMTTLLAAFLSAKWAVDRVYREKWWERKEKAYADIIEALHDMIRYCDLMADEYLERQEHPMKKEFSDKHKEAYWKIQKSTDIGAFVISKDAAAILHKLRQRPRLNWEDNPPWDIYEEDAKYYRQALSDIRDCAHKDLRV